MGYLYERQEERRKAIECYERFLKEAGPQHDRSRWVRERITALKAEEFMQSPDR